MRQVICTLPEGGTLLVSAGSFGRTIVRDDIVDVDRVLVPATDATAEAPARAAVTLADALGHHLAEAFEPYVPPAGVETSPRRRATAVSAAPAQE